MKCDIWNDQQRASKDAVLLMNVVVSLSANWQENQNEGDCDEEEYIRVLGGWVMMIVMIAMLIAMMMMMMMKTKDILENRGRCWQDIGRGTLVRAVRFDDDGSLMEATTNYVMTIKKTRKVI